MSKNYRLRRQKAGDGISLHARRKKRVSGAEFNENLMPHMIASVIA
jgi:hypothetical protein